MRIILSILVTLLLAASVAGCNPPAPQFRGTDISAVDWGGDFELTAHTGKRVRLSDYRGKVVVLFFGYTHCPDICAPTLNRLAQLMQRLGPDAAHVQVLFVTVDPKHDTPAQLAGFVPKFYESFIGLTGTEAEIGAVTRDYKVAFQAEPKPGAMQPVIAHFGGMMVKDSSGKLRVMLKNDASIDDIVHDVRVLLAARI
jgi:protein SCO1/2